jgi:TPR repeat protein
MVQAMQLFQKAAAQGNAVAESNIGALYKNGMGVTRDYNQAMQWYQKAAAHGFTGAEANIAKLKNAQATQP